MLHKFCCCIPIDRGCILIAITNIVLSGVTFVVQENVWTIVDLVLVLLSSVLLLYGSIKHFRFAVILYILVETIHITEMCAGSIVLFADMIAYKKFSCVCDSHECENNHETCDKMGVALASFLWIHTLAALWFLKCAFDFLMDIHEIKSDEPAEDFDL